MGKPTGFLDYARMDCPARSAEARVADWAPLDLPLSEKNRRRQSGRCMDCGVPFCQAGVTFDGALLGCPLHNLIPEWNNLLWNGNYEGALQRLLKTSPFPEFTARVCPALCEKACVCSRVSQPVTVRENELAIIEYAFENDLMQPMPPAARSDKRIAVMGSGPAGLSAAYYLNRRGHHVTVFERDPLPGGLLTYGIPEMKLPKRIVTRRISLLEQEGVVFRTNCCVGRDLSPEALAAEFDLAIFCCGAMPRSASGCRRTGPEPPSAAMPGISMPSSPGTRRLRRSCSRRIRTPSRPPAASTPSSIRTAASPPTARPCSARTIWRASAPFSRL